MDDIFTDTMKYCQGGIKEEDCRPGDWQLGHHVKGLNSGIPGRMVFCSVCRKEWSEWVEYLGWKMSGGDGVDRSGSKKEEGQNERMPR